MIRRLLRGNQDDRLRATWRILLPLVVFFAGVIVASPLLEPVGVLWFMVGQRAWMFVLMIGVLFLAARHIDRRSLADYGFRFSREWYLDFIAGAILGVAMMGTLIGIPLVQGDLRIIDVGSAGDAGSFFLGISLFLLAWVFVAFWEEALFRGIFITNAIEGFSTRELSMRSSAVGAWAISTAVFAVIHIFFGTVPPGTSLAQMLVAWFALGGLFGLAYVLSGSLAFPIGLHFTVNVTINNLFSFAGGEVLFPAIFRVEAVGAEVYSLIAELGILLPIVSLGYVAVLGWFYRQRGGLAYGVKHNVTA